MSNATRATAGRPAHQCAPATADVEEQVAVAQPELAADVIQLVALRLVQRFVGARE